jgi:alpha-galactosidase
LTPFKTTAQSYFHWGTEIPQSFTVDFASIGLTGSYKLRDVWRQKDLGTFTGTYQTEIRHHGVVMLKLVPSKKP